MKTETRVLPPAPRPFRAQTLAWELGRDAFLRGAVLLAVVAAAVFVIVYDGTADLWTSLAVLTVFFTWLGMGAVSASVSRRLPQVAALTETGPDQAEAMITQALRRRGLLRWVRLMVYHRLAVLRHRQRRYEETAAICAAVLRHPLGPGESARAHLLLMLAESRLQLSDPEGAWPVLLELYATRLSLVEALQRMALQTRYEVVVGHHAAAMHAADRKIGLAELMPGPQCGAMHAMLATAARATRHEDLAGWLWRRAELLCSPDQLRRLTEGGFGLPVVGVWEPTVEPNP